MRADVPAWVWWLGGGLALAVAAAARSPLTLAHLRAILPRLPNARALLLVPHLGAMLREADATAPHRAAALLAQVLHETDELRALTEYADGSAYGPSINPRLAARLGNRTDAEARALRGRGFVMLTGRLNYEAAGAALGLPLLERPELAAEPHHAARIGAWFWRTRGLNAYVDAGDFVGQTRALNGGENGLAHRQALHAAALAALSPPPSQAGVA